jgi:hypothetical protein
MDERVVAALLERIANSKPLPGLEKAVENIVERNGRFNGRNITQFLHAYDVEMLLKGILDGPKLLACYRVCTPGLQTRISELQAANDTWSAFKDGLLAIRGFEDWVMSPKNMSLAQTLNVFEDMYEQLSTRERTLLDPDKVMLLL